MCRKFIVIGISDSRTPELPSQARCAIAGARVFSGGRRHHEIVKGLLPEGSQWIDITVPLQEVFSRYRQVGDGEIVVFASGDPLFSGFATTLRREFPEAETVVVPSFNSLQLLAHAMLLPYQDMVNVTLTGRSWNAFDRQLILATPLIGVLTDRSKNPAAIAARMLQYGYDNYRVTVGEHMGNEECQRISTMTVKEAAHREFEMPNCMILEMTRCRRRNHGLADAEFSHLDGREKMITKMPIRLLSIAMLDLAERHTLWDVGFCTASISIEAKLLYPALDIVAIERRSESAKLFEENTAKFGTPGIQCVIGDFFNLDLTTLPRPDAIFIGGHGGRLAEMLTRLKEVMLPGCSIVFNSVSEESCQSFILAATQLGLTITERHRILLDDNNPINVLKAISN